MKRAMLILACLLVLFTLLVPALGLAKEAPANAATTVAPTASLIVYPAAPPDVSAEEAKAATPWMKPGDTLNLIIAIGSLGAIGAIIVWGIIASRKSSAVA